MSPPDHIEEVFLKPGDFHFGNRNTRIKTILGSCISITMWHPKLHIGGMCHYMLPSRNNTRLEKLNGKYADEALTLFLRKIQAIGTRPGDYEVKMFGGGNMFPSIGRADTCSPGASPEEILDCKNVSCKNKAMAAYLAKTHKLNVTVLDLGENTHRQIIFELWNGHVWVRKVNDPKHRC